MKSSKTFNNISDELKATIPVLKPGETVVFQMLNGVPNPEPDEKERTKTPVLYGKRQVQTNFRIFDPFQKNSSGEKKGGYVDMGCVDQWDKDEPARFRFFVPGHGEFSQFQGKFSLTGGNIRDTELFECLYLSNEREGNPHRDPSIEPLFKMIDLRADSKASVGKVAILRKALELVKDMPEDKARQVMAALNQPSYQDKEVLMAKIGELASSKPDVLIQVYESKETPLKALVKEALDTNVISHDLASGKVTMAGVEIHQMKGVTGEAFITEMATWLDTAENGKNVLNNIKSRMKKEPVTVQ